MSVVKLFGAAYFIRDKGLIAGMGGDIIDFKTREEAESYAASLADGIRFYFITEYFATESGAAAISEGQKGW